MRKAKVLSLPETIKEKSTFRAKALCRESVGALRQELVLKNIGLFQKRPAPLPQKKMKIPHSVASHRGLRHLPSSMTEISSVGGGDMGSVSTTDENFHQIDYHFWGRGQY